MHARGCFLCGAYCRDRSIDKTFRFDCARHFAAQCLRDHQIVRFALARIANGSDIERMGGNCHFRHFVQRHRACRTNDRPKIYDRYPRWTNFLPRTCICGAVWLFVFRRNIVNQRVHRCCTCAFWHFIRRNAAETCKAIRAICRIKKLTCRQLVTV